ncbi:hypothetical protein lbkm_1773 [Lachnospiraceae bacterium KM106-2]|nr:hypothetical protein lbkm_1773 [Lachnospiraceae bacterium KM106-2]
MDKVIEQQFLTGERALFGAQDMEINYCTFADGESPLKESSEISLFHSMFKWKYPLWYCKNITVNDCTLFETARSGIWYTHNITLTDCIVEAPKTFRRASKIKLKNVSMINAEETFWNCSDIQLEDVIAKGDYFGMNSQNIKIDGFELSGNYCFDGGKNIEIHNAKLLSKDSFWNCENVTVYDSFISGEYLGWNSKNVTFINCTIESLQGMCYMENIVMKNCRLINTTLSFEYSSVKAEIKGTIDSVFNPSSGTIRAEAIDEVTLDETKINPAKTTIKVGEFANAI